jgi:glycerol kinase
MTYILALDQGTTSSRSIIFDEHGETIAIAQREHRQIFPKSGWVEHDPEEIWLAQSQTAVEALEASGLDHSDIKGLGITNQRESVVVWDRKTGVPIHNAIVWQDRRTSAYCDDVRRTHGDLIRKRTGLEVDAYFSASKARWLLNNIPDAQAQAEDGQLAFGTIDSWLVWKLTEGEIHATDPSNASRTMLFDINAGKWDDELLNIFDIPHMMLPNIVDSSGVIAEVASISELSGLSIGGIAGDQQAALFGQGCFSEDSAKCTYGTGCFLLKNTGLSPKPSHNHLLSTVGWRMGGETTFALEGSVFIGGAVVQWLRDALGFIETSADVEALANEVADNGGVYFVPAFTGLGTPHWDQDARGTIVGLTRGTGRAHIARAALEAIAHQTADLVAAMNADSGSDLTELRVDGGAVDNNLLMQIQADLLQIPVVRSKVRETTALGAAYLAGLAVGVWNSIDEISEHWQADGVFEPQISAAEASARTERWNDAVRRALGWENKGEAD